MSNQLMFCGLNFFNATKDYAKRLHFDMSMKTLEIKKTF